MYTGRSLHIYIEHRNFEIRKTRNDFSVQIRNLLLPLSLKFFRHKERGTIFLFWLFHLLPQHVWHLPQRSPRASESQPSRLVSSSQLSDFFEISQNPPRTSGAWRHSHCVTPFPISGYCDISEWHVRSARACEHLF